MRRVRYTSKKIKNNRMRIALEQLGCIVIEGGSVALINRNFLVQVFKFFFTGHSNLIFLEKIVIM